MKKNKKRIKKAPAYADGGGFDMNGLSGMIGLAGSLIDILPTGKSTATSAAEADAQGVTGAFKGAATGAQIGAKVGGPWGAAIGAVGGGILGGIGKSGETILTPGFTEDNQYTYTTGLKRVFGGSSRDRRRIYRDRSNVVGNRSAVTGSINLQNDYYANNQMDAYMLAEGGMIPGQMAYVDDGELIDTTTGISQVPENNQPTDSNLVTLPMGSRVLSDKLKVPGTKKTFAQIGNEMMSKRRSKGSDRISETTNMLNDRNDQMIYDELFVLQEMSKGGRVIQPKRKNVPAFEDGGRQTEPWRQIASSDGDGFINRGLRQLWDTFSSKIREGRDRANAAGDLSFSYQAPPSGERGLGAPASATARRITRTSTQVNDSGIDGVTQETPPNRSMYPSGTSTVTPTQYRTASTGQTPTTASTNTTPTTGSTGQRSATTASSEPSQPRRTLRTNVSSNERPAPIFGRTPASATPPIPQFSEEAIARTGRTYQTPDDAGDNPSGNFNWEQLASSIGSLSPIIANLFPGSAEQIRPEYNPYNDAILSTMRNRRYNSRPILNQLGRNRATANYNIDQLNTNTGANLAARVATADMLGRQTADVLANEQNVNNDYAAQYADAMNNSGQQYVTANRLAQDYNARSRAQNRNIRRTGLSQLSTWTQAQARERNLRNRDSAYLDAYRPLLESAYTSDIYTDILNNLNR